MPCNKVEVEEQGEEDGKEHCGEKLEQGDPLRNLDVLRRVRTCRQFSSVTRATRGVKKRRTLDNAFEEQDESDSDVDSRSPSSEVMCLLVA